jgi:hypothetical protein
MDQEVWELEVDRDIGEWLSKRDKNLPNELHELIVSRGWENEGKISDKPDQEGKREGVAAIILATAALVKALTPIITTFIRERFPNGTVTEHRRPGGKRVLRASRGE